MHEVACRPLRHCYQMQICMHRCRCVRHTMCRLDNSLLEVASCHPSGALKTRCGGAAGHGCAMPLSLHWACGADGALRTHPMTHIGTSL